MPASSRLETEMMKVTKLRQAAGEHRHQYLFRLLEGGQKLTKPLWNTLSAEAQQWYNDGVNGYMAHNSVDDIPDFPDINTGTERATLSLRPVETASEVPGEPVPEPGPVPAPIEEPDGDDEDMAPVDEPDEELDEAAQEADEGDKAPVEDDEALEEALEYGRAEEPEEDEAPVEEEEPAPVEAAAPVKKPAKQAPKPKPAVKSPSKPAGPVKKPVKAATGNGPDPSGVSRPPKPAAPGASTFIKRALLKNVHVTNAELMEKLREKGITVTAISVSTIRSDFRHSLKVLQEAGFCQEIEAP